MLTDVTARMCVSVDWLIMYFMSRYILGTGHDLPGCVRRIKNIGMCPARSGRGGGSVH